MNHLIDNKGKAGRPEVAPGHNLVLMAREMHQNGSTKEAIYQAWKQNNYHPSKGTRSKHLKKALAEAPKMLSSSPIAMATIISSPPVPIPIPRVPSNLGITYDPGPVPLVPADWTVPANHMMHQENRRVSWEQRFPAKSSSSENNNPNPVVSLSGFRHQPDVSSWTHNAVSLPASSTNAPPQRGVLPPNHNGLRHHFRTTGVVYHNSENSTNGPHASLPVPPDPWLAHESLVSTYVGPAEQGEDLSNTIMFGPEVEQEERRAWDRHHLKQHNGSSATIGQLGTPVHFDGSFWPIGVSNNVAPQSETPQYMNHSDDIIDGKCVASMDWSGTQYPPTRTSQFPNTLRPDAYIKPQHYSLSTNGDATSDETRSNHHANQSQMSFGTPSQGSSSAPFVDRIHSPATRSSFEGYPNLLSATGQPVPLMVNEQSWSAAPNPNIPYDSVANSSYMSQQPSPFGHGQIGFPPSQNTTTQWVQPVAAERQDVAPYLGGPAPMSLARTHMGRSSNRAGLSEPGVGANHRAHHNANGQNRTASNLNTERNQNNAITWTEFVKLRRFLLSKKLDLTLLTLGNESGWGEKVRRAGSSM